MKRVRQTAVRTLESLGVKRSVKAGLNRILGASGLPLVGEPPVFADLRRLAGTARPRPERPTGRVLFFTMRGWTTHVALECMLGEALAQRGVEPVYFTCGGPLPLCGITNFRAPDPTPCGDCHGFVERFMEPFGFDSLTLAELVPEPERAGIVAPLAAVDDERLDSFVHDGLELGRMVQISANWFLLRGSRGSDRRWFDVQRQFLTSALVIERAAERLCQRFAPDRIVALNGLFFAEQVLRAVAARRGIPVTTYERGLTWGTWIFRHDDVACDLRVAPDFRKLADRPLDGDQSRKLEELFAARSRGRGIEVYWPSIDPDRETLIRTLALDPAKPVVSVFPNITWDSAIQGRDVAFDGLFDWLEQTVRAFAGRDDAQLVIRIHPAEVRLDRRQTTERVVDVLVERLGSLPSSVRILPAESPLSSYTLARLSRFVMVYTSTMGLEMASSGLPVVVAGATHYRGLGFTLDIDRREELAPLIERLLAGEPAGTDAERARRYAHFLFFRYMIPLGLTREPDFGPVRLPQTSFDELAPGRDAVLDAVARGLIEGEPIWNPGA